MGRQQRQNDWTVVDRQTPMQASSRGGYDFERNSEEVMEHLLRIPPRDKRGRSLKRSAQWL